jgi:hypothetical protein
MTASDNFIANDQDRADGGIWTGHSKGAPRFVEGSADVSLIVWPGHHHEYARLRDWVNPQSM